MNVETRIEKFAKMVEPIIFAAFDKSTRDWAMEENFDRNTLKIVLLQRDCPNDKPETPKWRIRREDMIDATYKDILRSMETVGGSFLQVGNNGWILANPVDSKFGRVKKFHLADIEQRVTLFVELE